MSNTRAMQGFTLLEMTIVLAIVGLLVTGLVRSLGAQIDVQSLNKTRTVLDNAKEALIGFTLINGRLPCPASSANGFEDPIGGGTCTAVNGFLPAATLGMSELDSNGYALDGWGGNPINRVRYAVTDATANLFTTSINTFTANPDLKICGSAAGITASACGSGLGLSLTSDAVAVIYSLGQYPAGRSSDEQENQDSDKFFVAHTPITAFDDQVTWLSYPQLAARLVAAGKLPQ